MHDKPANDTVLTSLDGPCPACNAEWAYEINGETYYRVVGEYSRERDCTVAYRCEFCGARWDRFTGQPLPSNRREP